MSNITIRHCPTPAFEALNKSGLPPVLARIYAARGIKNPNQLEAELSRLIPFDQLKNITLMASTLADAIAAKKRLLIVADYDSDGATACRGRHTHTCKNLALLSITLFPTASSTATV